MRLQEISYALKTVADVAHAGEQLVGSLDRARSRSHIGSILLGAGLGVGLGALLFSESARQQVRLWLVGAPVAARANGGSSVGSTVESRGEVSAPH